MFDIVYRSSAYNNSAVMGNR